MKRASGSYGASGEGAKVSSHVRRGRGRVTASRDRDLKIDRKSGPQARLDMPTKVDLEQAMQDGFCWWCGATHTKEGKGIEAWGMHFAKGHGFDLQPIRDVLEIPKNQGIVAQSLRRRLVRVARRRYKEHRLGEKLHSTEARRKRRHHRTFSKYGRAVQREKALSVGVEQRKRAARTGANKQLARRARNCTCCGVLFSPLTGGKNARKTCSDACSSELKRRGARNQAEKHRVGAPKLSASDIIAIRCEYAGGTASTPELAGRYGVWPSTIHKIVCGKSWKHVGGPLAQTR